MHFDPDGECFVADGRNDFDGWTILWAERWKDGVQRVHCKRFMGTRASIPDTHCRLLGRPVSPQRDIHLDGRWEYRLVYAKDELTPWGGLVAGRAAPA
jgi:hypothetical protein